MPPFALLCIKHVKKFESCLWLVQLLNAVIGLFLIIIFLFVRFRRYTVCLSVIKSHFYPHPKSAVLLLLTHLLLWQHMLSKLRKTTLF